MRNLELPTQISPCLRIFIASLLNEPKTGATHEIQGLPSPLVTTVENDRLRDEAKRMPTNSWTPVSTRGEPLRRKGRRSGVRGDGCIWR